MSLSHKRKGSLSIVGVSILPYAEIEQNYCKRQITHTFTPSNQHDTIGSGGDANETFTGRVERNHQRI